MHAGNADINGDTAVTLMTAVYKAWKKKSTEIRRPPVYLDEIPVNDPLSKPEFFLEFRCSSCRECKHKPRRERLCRERLLLV